jgi:hypothetical protein
MRTHSERMRCTKCKRRTAHTVHISRQRGRGREAYHDIERRCDECGLVAKSQRYPNLLSDFFSVPARTTEAPHDEPT